jgi:alkylhydroperoxidase family enzyme
MALNAGPRSLAMSAVHAVRAWPVASQQKARRNAMLACTSLTQRRMERRDVEDFLHSFYGILAHSPEFLAGYMDLGIAITAACALPGRSRELLILRTGWLCGAPYQWGEHVRIARDHSLSSDDIERVTHGSAAPGWTAQDRALLRAAEELHADAMIGDETWQALAQFLDQRQLLEVPIVVGHYHTTAFLQNAVRVALNDHNPGLSSR